MSHYESAFQDLYAAFQPKIYRYLTGLVGEHEAEDLTQEVFVKVYQALPTFRGEARVSTWIYRIATNAALDKLRSPSFRRMLPNRTADSAVVFYERERAEQEGWIGEKPLSLETALIRKEMNACIRDVIARLPPNYQTVIVLSELQEFTNNEIADILGLRLGAVNIRLHRARAALRKALETHCHFYSIAMNKTN
ncbi:MAG: sigma-70 family RNA polymerase sigma factor [Chloroflexus sp.]